MEKLNEYYERTAASDAHLIAMGKPMIFCLLLSYTQTGVALNSADKFGYFRKHWGEDLYQEVLQTVQKRVHDFYYSFTYCLHFKPVHRAIQPTSWRHGFNLHNAWTKIIAAITP